MPVTAGVMHDLKLASRDEAGSALEALALALAGEIDGPELDGKTLAGLSRELRLTLAQLRAQGQDTGEDVVDRLSTTVNADPGPIATGKR